MPPKIQPNKNVCLTSQKLKTSIKAFLKGTKIKATDWEKMFANHIFSKGLYPVYIKKSQISTIRKIMQLLFNVQKI